MANATTLDAIGPAIMSNGAIPSLNGDASHLSPEAKIAWAKDVIAGRIPQPTMPAHPEFAEILLREFADRAAPPSPSAIRRISERLSLQAEYKGVPVGCLITSDDSYPVLAVGMPEIKSLFQALTDDELSRVMIVDTVE